MEVMKQQVIFTVNAFIVIIQTIFFENIEPVEKKRRCVRKLISGEICSDGKIFAEVRYSEQWDVYNKQLVGNTIH